MFFFKLSWLGIMGYLVLIVSIIEGGDYWIGGLICLAIYYLLYHSINPFKPWMDK